MTRILLLSDIHCEWMPDRGEAFFRQYADFDDYDVAVIAGDLSNFETMAEAIVNASENLKEVVWVLGNHCCYEGSINQAIRRAEAIAAGLPNVHFLEASSVTIDGTKFMGATMWFPEQHDNELYENYMTDFRLIRDLRSTVYKQNAWGLAYLNSQVEPGCVVVTHHLPSSRSTPTRFLRSALNRFFICDQEELIREGRPALWLHGHTHDSCDYQIGTTRVVANPYGYHGHETNPDFNPRLVVEVP